MSAEGRVDVLANNAGIARRDAFLAIASADWDRILAVNLRGMFLVAQAVSRRMAARGGGGVIINMSSTNGIAGEEDPRPLQRLEGRRAAAHQDHGGGAGPPRDPGERAIPRLHPPPLNEAISGEIGGDAFVEAYVRDRIPLGRAGRAADVAAAHAFPASGDAAFIHGSALVIDGGQLAVM